MHEPSPLSPEKPRSSTEQKTALAMPVNYAGENRQHRRSNEWNRHFDLKKAPKLWQAAGWGNRSPSAE